MTLDDLMDQCLQAGVKIVVKGEDTVTLKGPTDAIQRFAPLLRPHKATIIADALGVVDELMEQDGLSREDALAIVASYVRPRPPAAWLALIEELDHLISQYCEAAKLREDEKARIMAARRSQPLTTIPETLAWFKKELKAL